MHCRSTPVLLCKNTAYPSSEPILFRFNFQLDLRGSSSTVSGSLLHLTFALCFRVRPFKSKPIKDHDWFDLKTVLSIKPIIVRLAPDSAPAPKVAICRPNTHVFPPWLCGETTGLLHLPPITDSVSRVVSAQKKNSFANSHVVTKTAPSSPTVGSSNISITVDSANTLHSCSPNVATPETLRIISNCLPIKCFIKKERGSSLSTCSIVHITLPHWRTSSITQ